MKQIIYRIPEDSEDIRIDKYLSELSDDLSRSYLQKLISDGNLLVNGNTVKPSYQVKYDDIIELSIPDNIQPEILPEDIPLQIEYEDEDLLVVNKPKGMVVHPAAGHTSGTLVNALMFHCTDLSGINGILRPGIVHRIDKDTSGLLVCAKNDFAHSSLAEQLKEHSITRKYEAIAVGSFKIAEGTIDKPIGRSQNDRKLMAINEKSGRKAVTHYRVIDQNNKYSHIECILETGRTHQIRVHMKSISHPLLGDIVYGGKMSEYKLDGNELQGQSLHARVLGFVHPRSGEYMEFTSDLPDYFIRLLEKFDLN